MSENRTLKKEMYYDEAIRLHFELGYGEDRVAEILPIGHTTAWRWFRKFAAENKVKTTAMARTKREKTTPKASDEEAKDDLQALKAELSAVKAKLKMAELRADLYDEIINVAEKKFKVEIRKKAGAKR
jgi:hypothetical protein